jgi:23S rRNA (guanosine2251-2'-O)-methyltransferase
VAAALINPDRTKHKLLATANAQTRLAEEVIALDPSIDASTPFSALAPDLTIETVASNALTRQLGGDAVHQGCVLECDPLAAEDRLDPSQITRALVLDQITDPHNVGAILRSAAAFAVDAVITTARHSPAETGVLAKSASGALDHVPLVRVRNLGDALDAMSGAGITLVGLDSEGPAPLSDVPFAPPYALVLGAEGKGLRQKTRGLCTHLARLDMPGTIKSLNVSNAAAIALYAARTREI